MLRRLVSTLLFLYTTNASAHTVYQVQTSQELIDKLKNTGAASVPDGGIIELAPGTYEAPESGFEIKNPDRSFTIRAALPDTVYLDGGGQERIFSFVVNDATRGGAVVFEGLTFRQGRSTHSAFGSAITLQGAHALFIDCVFEANKNESTGGGAGTVGVSQASTAFFLRTVLRDNTSKTSGAGAVVTDSTLWCHECQFVRNRNNVAGHSITATGGGMVAVRGSSVYLSNTRFEGNQAGFAGGAFDVKGRFTDASPARVIAANSTFVDNLAQPYPGTQTNSPTVGGVANVEDNAIFQLYNSRLVDNSAQFGGAVAVYRAIFEADSSAFRGNFATGRDNRAPRGGTIFAVSDDTSADGDHNRPTAQVVIRDSLFHGQLTSARRGSQTAAAHTGGCVYTSGDLNRLLGQGGVDPNGSQDENSALLEISGSAFVDCDVDQLIAAGALGGGIFSELAKIHLKDSLFIDANANGADGAGGAAAFTRYADVAISNTQFANNFAVRGGGALFMLGAKVDIDNSTFFRNIVPGNQPFLSRGAAIYTGPQGALGVEGKIQNSLFTANQGLPIWEGDSQCGSEINRVTYQNNDFFSTVFESNVYRNTFINATLDAEGLNDLVIHRGNCSAIDKAPADDNEQMAIQPMAGALLGVPPRIMDHAAAGDTTSSTEAALAFAWSGGCAELDGDALSNSTGLLTAADAKDYFLDVFDNSACGGAADLIDSATIAQARTPVAALTADPVVISGGESSTLTWQATPDDETFVQAAIDQGLGVLASASGSDSVSPALTTTYTLLAMTEVGGASTQTIVWVDDEPDLDLIFADGFESGDTSGWSLQQ